MNYRDRKKLPFTKNKSFESSKCLHLLYSDLVKYHQKFKKRMPTPNGIGIQ